MINNFLLHCFYIKVNVRTNYVLHVFNFFGGGPQDNIGLRAPLGHGSPLPGQIQNVRHVTTRHDTTSTTCRASRDMT